MLSLLPDFFKRPDKYSRFAQAIETDIKTRVKKIEKIRKDKGLEYLIGPEYNSDGSILPIAQLYYNGKDPTALHLFIKQEKERISSIHPNKQTAAEKALMKNKILIYNNKITVNVAESKSLTKIDIEKLADPIHKREAMYLGKGVEVSLSIDALFNIKQLYKRNNYACSFGFSTKQRQKIKSRVTELNGYDEKNIDSYELKPLTGDLLQQIPTKQQAMRMKETIAPRRPSFSFSDSDIYRQGKTSYSDADIELFKKQDNLISQFFKEGNLKKQKKLFEKIKQSGKETITRRKD